MRFMDWSEMLKRSPDAHITNCTKVSSSRMWVAMISILVSDGLQG